MKRFYIIWKFKKQTIQEVILVLFYSTSFKSLQGLFCKLIQIYLCDVVAFPKILGRSFILFVSKVRGIKPPMFQKFELTFIVLEKIFLFSSKSLNFWED